MPILKLAPKERNNRTTEIIAIETEEVDDCSKYAYHRKCYFSFMNIAFMKRAEVRCKKAKESQDSTESSDSESECNNPIPKKTFTIIFQCSYVHCCVQGRARTTSYLHNL